MHLILGQLIYTSFSKIGFTSIASEQVPTNIQQFFIKRVVFYYWDTYKQLSSEYKAVYLHQVIPEQTLFGWLYNSGVDDLGRGPIPYFICYYLSEPLSAFLLEIVFTLLQKGPIELVDRQSPPISLKPVLIKNLWHYKSAYSGVEICLDVRKQNHFALKQGKSLSLFIPTNEQAMVVELNKQVQSQELVTAQRNTQHNSLQLYQTSLLLLGISLGAVLSGLILITSYTVLQINNSTLDHPRVLSSEISLVFYKTLAEVPNIPKGLFDYGESTVFAPLWSKNIVSAITQAQPQFELRYVEPAESQYSTSTGIEMLLRNELSFFQSSRPIKDNEFFEAKERGFTLEQIPIAIDGIAFYVNSQVSIPGLSLSQLKDIFTGKLTNWKAVGGPDLKITAFSPNPQTEDTIAFLEEKLFAGAEFSPTVQKVETTTESIRKVAQTPGGISFATASRVVGQTTIHPLPLSKEAGQAFVSPCVDAKLSEVNKAAFANASYPLTRRLFIIIKRDGTLDEQAGSAYISLLLTDEAQQLIAHAGFVPIR